MLKLRKLLVLWRGKWCAFWYGQKDYVKLLFAASATMEELETLLREAIEAAPAQDLRDGCLLIIQRARQAHAAIESLIDALAACAKRDKKTAKGESR